MAAAATRIATILRVLDRRPPLGACTPTPSCPPGSGGDPLLARGESGRAPRLMRPLPAPYVTRGDCCGSRPSPPGRDRALQARAGSLTGSGRRLVEEVQLRRGLER